MIIEKIGEKKLALKLTFNKSRATRNFSFNFYTKEQILVVCFFSNFDVTWVSGFNFSTEV